MSSSVNRSASRARATESGRYWSSRPAPISPSGITSISVRSMPRPCAHSSSRGNSSPLTSLSATALILIFRPAACAASIPASTWSNAPQRVMARNFSASSVSSETLIRRTPAAAIASAYLASCEPLVVKVSSSSAPEARCRASELTSVMMPRRTSGSPPVRRSFRTPRATKAAHKRSSSSRVKNLGLRQKRHVFRHAIDAAEIAPVGDRDAQIGNDPAERVDEFRMPGCAVEFQRWHAGLHAIHLQSDKQRIVPD